MLPKIFNADCIYSSFILGFIERAKSTVFDHFFHFSVGVSMLLVCSACCGSALACGVILDGMNFRCSLYQWKRHQNHIPPTQLPKCQSRCERFIKRAAGFLDVNSGMESRRVWLGNPGGGGVQLKKFWAGWKWLLAEPPAPTPPTAVRQLGPKWGPTRCQKKTVKNCLNCKKKMPS